MNEDNQQIFLVQPLGQYGRTYALNRRTYRLYKFIQTFLAGFMGVLAVIQLIAPKVSSNLPWTNTQALVVLFCGSIFYIAMILMIASRGRTVSSGRIKSDKKDKRIAILLWAFGLYKWSMYISSGILLLVSILYVLGQIYTKQPIDYFAVLVFGFPSACIYAFIILKRTLRKPQD